MYNILVTLMPFHPIQPPNNITAVYNGEIFPFIQFHQPNNYIDIQINNQLLNLLTAVQISSLFAIMYLAHNSNI